MINLNKIHHIAIICSDYQRSRQFYIGILGLTVIKETYREERRSFKLDLALNGEYVLELFSFPDPPSRPSKPEALGLRHLAFEVDNVEETARALSRKGIEVEPIRVDGNTHKKFTFIADPDDLPIEFYEK